MSTRGTGLAGRVRRETRPTRERHDVMTLRDELKP